MALVMVALKRGIGVCRYDGDSLAVVSGWRV